jgi:hypothetical protein
MDGKKATTKASRIGRPLRAEEASREKVLARFTTSEMAAITASARKAGLPVASFVRDAAIRCAQVRFLPLDEKH